MQKQFLMNTRLSVHNLYKNNDKKSKNKNAFPVYINLKNRCRANKVIELIFWLLSVANRINAIS